MDACETYRYVVDVCESQNKDAPTPAEAKTLADNSVNIWQERSSPDGKFDWELELEQSEKQALVAGSFNKCVAHLTSFRSLGM
jgi:hypothetical protein